MSTKRIANIALYTAIVAIVTALIAVPIGTFGYINLSDLLIMSLCVLLDPSDAMIAGGLGAMISDIYLGYSQYAIPTLIIKALEALIVSKLLKRTPYKCLAFVAGGLWILVGYGATDTLLTMDMRMFLPSVLGNLPQALIAMVAASLAYTPLVRYFRKERHG